MTPDDLDALIDRMRQPGPGADAEPDYEAAWEARQDPEGDMQRMEDAYEKEMDARWEP